MKIELFGDYKRSKFIEFDSNISELGITGDMFPSDSFIHVICNVRMDEDLARVDGQVVLSAVLECSRCLELFGHDIIGDFSLVVRRLKKGEVIPHDYDDDEEEDESTEMEGKPAKDTDVTITKDSKIPLLTIHLFNPKTIPTAHTLSSPLLLIGAIGNMQFINKKTNEVSTAESHTIGLSNLGQIQLKPGNKVGSTLGIRCWKPKKMRNYKIVGKLIGFESLKLLEIDSQDKIKQIAAKLAKYCD